MTKLRINVMDNNEVIWAQSSCVCHCRRAKGRSALKKAEVTRALETCAFCAYHRKWVRQQELERRGATTRENSNRICGGNVHARETMAIQLEGAKPAREQLR